MPVPSEPDIPLVFDPLFIEEDVSAARVLNRVLAATLRTDGVVEREIYTSEDVERIRNAMNTQYQKFTAVVIANSSLKEEEKAVILDKIREAQSCLQDVLTRLLDDVPTELPKTGEAEESDI